MATDQNQDLNYKVKLDTNDLASQLQQVRAQIDQAVGSIAFNSTAVTAPPSQFAFPIQQYMQNAGLLAQSDMQGTMASVQMGARHVANMNDAAQLGFQKFNSDVQTALLTHGMPLINSAAGGYYPDPASRSFTSNAAAALVGWGYDPSYSITPGEFGRLSGRRAASQMTGAGMRVAGSYLGGAFGGMLTPWMPLAGNIAGTYLGERAGALVDDTLGATILRDFTYGQKIQEYAWDTSWRFLGGRFSRDQAEQIGVNLSTAQRSSNLLGYGVKAGDVSRVISEFTDIGGFDNVRSAEEYQTRAKAAIENHRKIMQVLKVTEGEALAVIKELNLNSNGSEDIGARAMQLSMSAYSTGLTGRELLQYAHQSAEMVRGTGINMGSAFWGGISMLENVRAGMESGVITTQQVRQYGTEQDYTLNLNRMAYNWAQGPAGFTAFAAASKAGSLGNIAGLTTTETLGLAAQTIAEGGTQNLLERLGAQSKMVANQDPKVLSASYALQISKEISATRNAPTEDAFIGYATQKYGMSVPDAQSLYRSQFYTPQDRRVGREHALQVSQDAAQSFLLISSERLGNELTKNLQIDWLGNRLRAEQRTMVDILTGTEASLHRRGHYHYDFGGNRFIVSEEFKKMDDKHAKAFINQFKHIYGDPKNLTEEERIALGETNANEIQGNTTLEKTQIAALRIGMASGEDLSTPGKVRAYLRSIQRTSTATINVAPITPAMQDAANSLTAQDTFSAIFGAGVGSLVARTMSPLTSFFSASERILDAQAETAYNAALKKEMEPYSKEMAQISKNIKALGGALDTSPALRNDPMIAINRMNMDIAQNTDKNLVDLIAMFKGQGKVQVVKSDGKTNAFD